MSFQQVSAKIKNRITPDLQHVSEADPDFERKVAALPAAHRAAIMTSQRGAEKSLEQVEQETGIADTRIIAKYKIEVLFGPKRTINGPNAVRLAVWESGSKLHGGGDASLFFCKDGTVENGEGCWAPIHQSQVKGDLALCNGCNKMINAAKLTIHKEGYCSTKFLTQEIVKLFAQLGSNADIYCKYNQDDIHYIAMARQHGNAKAARLLGLHMYRLENILKDTANGASLEKRVFAFLTS